jgi:hypothetical protein
MKAMFSLSMFLVRSVALLIGRGKVLLEWALGIDYRGYSLILNRGSCVHGELVLCLRAAFYGWNVSILSKL